MRHLGEERSVQHCHAPAPGVQSAVRESEISPNRSSVRPRDECSDTCANEANEAKGDCETGSERDAPDDAGRRCVVQHICDSRQTAGAGQRGAGCRVLEDEEGEAVPSKLEAPAPQTPTCWSLRERLRCSFPLPSPHRTVRCHPRLVSTKGPPLLVTSISEAASTSPQWTTDLAAEPVQSITELRCRPDALPTSSARRLPPPAHAARSMTLHQLQPLQRLARGGAVRHRLRTAWATPRLARRAGKFASVDAPVPSGLSLARGCWSAFAPP